MNNWPDNLQLDNANLSVLREHFNKAERYFNGKAIDKSVQRRAIVSMAEFIFKLVESALPSLAVSIAEYKFITQGIGQGYLTRLPSEFLTLIAKMEGSEILVEMLGDSNKLFTKIFAFTLWREMTYKYRAAFSPYRVRLNVDRKFNPWFETATKLSKISGEIYPPGENPFQRKKDQSRVDLVSEDVESVDKDTRLKVRNMLDPTLYKKTIDKVQKVEALRKSFEANPVVTEFINVVVEVLPMRVPLNYCMLTALARSKYPLFIPEKIKSVILQNLSITARASFLKDETNNFVAIFWHLVAEISKIHPVTEVTDSRIIEGYVLFDDGNVYNTFNFSTGYIDGSYLTSFILSQNRANSETEATEEEEEPEDDFMTIEPTETDLEAVSQDFGDILEQ